MFSTVISSIALTSAALVSAVVILRPKFLIKRLRLNIFFRKEPELIAVISGGILLIVLDLCLGQQDRLAADIAIPALPMTVLPQAADTKEGRQFFRGLIVAEVVAAAASLLCFFGLYHPALHALRPLGVFFIAVSFFAIFFRHHLARLKSPSDRLTPLSLSSLFSDVIYLFLLGFSLILSAMSCSVALAGRFPFTAAVDSISFVLASSVFICALLRRAGSRRFLFFEKYEKMVSEAVQDCVGSRIIRADRKENLYRSIFSRIEEYFRNESPFLDTDLSIAEVSERIFTNKVYVSRAISECADTNFCQYVNRYRIGYAMDCFRQNPALRVSDLAYMSGFRTVASYNMAFRRVAGEIPSDWMRRTAAVMKRGVGGLNVAGAVAV